MREFFTKFILTILAILSVIIFLIFIQNIIYNGKPFVTLNYRFTIMENDNDKFHLKKNDLIIINQNNAKKVKEKQVVAYKTSNEKVSIAKIEIINNKTIEVELNDGTVQSIKKKDLLGPCEITVPIIGKYIIYIRTLKGFLVSIGIIFALLLFITWFNKIILFIKKLFTKKY